MLIIPTRSDLAAYSFQITLDGDIFIFAFRWNTEGEYWTFDILDFASNPLIVGVKVVINYPLIHRYASDLLPKGEILAVDGSAKLERIGREDLGNVVQLVYLTQAENDAFIWSGHKCAGRWEVIPE